MTQCESIVVTKGGLYGAFAHTCDRELSCSSERGKSAKADSVDRRCNILCHIYQHKVDENIQLNLVTRTFDAM